MLPKKLIAAITSYIQLLFLLSCSNQGLLKVICGRKLIIFINVPTTLYLVNGIR